MSDKMREEFEAWHREQVTMLMVAGEPAAASNARHLEPVYWCAWQASREVLVIDLPEAYATDSDGHWMLPRKDVRTAIEAAGLKVTP